MRNLLMVLVALGLGAKRHWHIFVAIVLGVVGGLFFQVNDMHPPQVYHYVIEFIGQLFVRAITMLALPLMISSLVIGITSLGDTRQFGKIGGKTVFIFFFTMIIASSLAAFIAYTFHPGTYISQDFMASIAAKSHNNFSHLGTFHHVGESPQFLSSLRELQPGTFGDNILRMIPENPFEALATNMLVPVVAFVVLFASAMACIGDTARPLIAVFEAIFATTMKIVDWLMILAVPGVAALTFTVFAYAGPQLLGEIAPYMGCVIGALFIQAFVVYPIMLAVVARVNFMDVYRGASEALLVAFGTASSSATLPVTLACVERRIGVSNRIASFVLPTGATMNMNGTTMFEVIAVMFLAQIYGVPMTFENVLTITALGIIAAISAAGIPSAGLVTMAVVLNGLGTQFSPIQVTTGMALIWSVDRILDMFRTTLNVIDDCAASTMIAASEGELNRDILTNADRWRDVV